MAATGLAADSPATRPDFLLAADGFAARETTEGISSIGEKLVFRATDQPFLLIASVIFVLAIVHTFLAVPITRIAHRVQHEHEAKLPAGAGDAERTSFKATVLHFLGEVEAIFGIWALILLGTMTAMHGLSSMTSYMAGIQFTEPLFVIVIMALASTRPILRFAEACLGGVAKLGKQTPAAWWLSIMIVAPLLGSFITEPGAMTIAAMLLATKFYRLKPSPTFAYATLGLLFVNISVGGLLTNFAAPPVLMVARKWGLTNAEMFVHYGEKAIVSVVVCTMIYYLFFRKELAAMKGMATSGHNVPHERPIPLFVTVTHLAFMAFTVMFSHYPPLFIGGFLFFLAFSQATPRHQEPLRLRGPVLVGFFLGGLVVHGGLQGWWLAPVISSLSEVPLFLGSTILTSFNDNAAITYLASQVEGLTPQMKYAVLAGAVTGGGLTVIANAPNPAGQSLLARFFGEGVSPLKLAAAALLPTVVVALCMMFFPDRGIDEMFAPADEAAETSSTHP